MSSPLLDIKGNGQPKGGKAINMKEFTAEMLATLWGANNATKGTSEYNKFYMPAENKCGNRWKFSLWSIPYSCGVIKTFKDKTYIIIESSVGATRYEVTREVRELLGI